MLPYTTYLIDLDGVMYRGNELLPGASAFVDWLNASQKKYVFLTNNSFNSETQVAQKLIDLGIHTDPHHVLGAGQAAVQNIARRFPGAKVYLVGEQPMREMLLEHDLKIADLDDPTADVVLVGLDRTFDYKKTTYAMKALMAGAAFIAVNRDPRLPTAGEQVPGCGAMVAAIEAASGVHPTVVGKPEPTLLQEAMHMLNSTPDETVMIGDTLQVDIMGGKNAGTHTLFVLSGSSSLADVKMLHIEPDHTYADIAAVLKELQTGDTP